MITAKEKRKQQRTNSMPYRKVCSRIKSAQGKSTTYVSEGRPMAKYILAELKKGGFKVKCRYVQRKDKQYAYRLKRWKTKSGWMRSAYRNVLTSEKLIKEWRYTISW